VADAGESLVIRQVRYAIKKSAKLLGDNVFVGLAMGMMHSYTDSVTLYIVATLFQCHLIFKIQS
jgi:hypothetical protein